MEYEPTAIEQSDINANNETSNIMKQSQMNEHKTQPFAQPSSGQGSKKYRKPCVEWIPLDNDISLALESSPPAGPLEGFNNYDMNGIKNNPYETFV